MMIAIVNFSLKFVKSNISSVVVVVLFCYFVSFSFNIVQIFASERFVYFESNYYN